MKTFQAGTLVGAGSFRCENCGFAVALQEGDEVPACPSCGGRPLPPLVDVRRGHLRGGTARGRAGAGLVGRGARGTVASGDYLAFEAGERVQVVSLQDGWTRIGLQPLGPRPIG